MNNYMGNDPIVSRYSMARRNLDKFSEEMEPNNLYDTISYAAALQEFQAVQHTVESDLKGRNSLIISLIDKMP